MLVFIDTLLLSSESINIFHFLLQVARIQGITFSYFGQGVSSIVLQIIFMSDFWLMSRINPIKLNLSQSFEIVIAAIDAKSPFVIE